VISKLKENIEKLEAAQSNNDFIDQARKEKEEALHELEDIRGEVEAKKKVISTLKGKIESLEAEGETLTGNVARLTEEKDKADKALEEQKKSMTEEAATARAELI